MFDIASLNCVVASAGLVPMTTSQEEFPKLGIAIDWDAKGNLYEVVEVPITVSCPN